MRSTTADRRSHRIARIALPLLFWLAVWQLAAMGVGQELLLPAPLEVLGTLLSLGRTPEFWRAASFSLVSIFGGLAAGVCIGGLLSVLTFFLRPLDWIFSPAVRVIRATPVASFIILLLLWVSRTYVPGVAAGLMALPVVWMNNVKGFEETDPLLLELAHTYRFGGFKTLRLVYLPSVRPYFAAGLQTALGLAWKAGVAAEVLCLPKASIGTQIYYSKLYLETPSLFAWTLTVIAFSFLLERVLKRLLKGRVTP